MHPPFPAPVKMAKPFFHPERRRSAVLAVLTFALTGCQGIANPDQAEVRIIDVASDLRGADIYQGDTPIAYNLAYGNITSYIRVHSGASDLSAQATGSRQIVASVHGAFSPAGRYTILMGNTFAAPDPVVLKDQATPAPAGQVALRFLHQAVSHGAVDVYLFPAAASFPPSTPLVAAQTFTGNSGYLTVPAGTYRIAVYPAGTFPGASPILRSPPAAYASESAATLILLDDARPGAPSLQMIASPDFDPAANPL